jgi:hypothetical protein
MEATVLGWSTDSQRYTVKFADGTEGRLKPQNLISKPAAISETRAVCAMSQKEEKAARKAAAKAKSASAPIATAVPAAAPPAAAAQSPVVMAAPAAAVIIAEAPGRESTDHQESSGLHDGEGFEVVGRKSKKKERKDDGVLPPPNGASAAPPIAPFGGRKVFIGGTAHLDEDELRASLEQFGGVASVEVLKDKDGMHRGFGFVTFHEVKSAQQLLNAHFIYVANVRIEAKHCYQPYSALVSDKVTESALQAAESARAAAAAAEAEKARRAKEQRAKEPQPSLVQQSQPLPAASSAAASSLLPSSSAANSLPLGVSHHEPPNSALLAAMHPSLGDFPTVHFANRADPLRLMPTQTTPAPASTAAAAAVVHDAPPLSDGPPSVFGAGNRLLPICRVMSSAIDCAR